jgi:hypothetical protein
MSVEVEEKGTASQRKQWTVDQLMQSLPAVSLK